MFLKDLVKTAPAGSPEPNPYKPEFAAITIVLTILYGATVFFILNHYLHNQDVGADMLKLYIGLIETVIGGFVGIVYGELYKHRRVGPSIGIRKWERKSETLELVSGPRVQTMSGRVAKLNVRPSFRLH